MVTVRGHQIKADLLRARGNDEDAQRSQSQALECFDRMQLSVVDNTPTQLCIDCARAFMERGHYDAGEQLLQALANINDDPDLAISIDRLLREPQTQAGIAYAAKLNKRGIEFHSNKQFADAAEAFRQVLDELPNHIGLNLNLIQTLLSKHKENDLDHQERVLLDSCFQRIGSLRENSQYRERYQYLQKRYDKISR